MTKLWSHFHGVTSPWVEIKPNINTLSVHAELRRDAHKQMLNARSAEDHNNHGSLLN